MIYLVTGCAGFIGCKVTELLLRDGHTVIGADDLNDAYDVRLKQWRLQQLEGRPGFQFHQLKKIYGEEIWSEETLIPHARGTHFLQGRNASGKV